MPPSVVQLRAPEEADAPALADLLAVLGHPAEPADVARRLASLERLDPGALRLVAELDGRVVGFVAAHQTPMLHRARAVGRITTLVVAPAEHGRGYGGLLLDAATQWLIHRGADRLELTSGSDRREAHRFYERRGWIQEGLRFVRELV